MIITFEIDVDTDIIRLHKPHSFGKQFLFCEKNPQKELLYQSTCLHNMVYFLPTFKRIFCRSKEPVCVGKQISWANIDMKREVAWDHVYNFAYNSSHYRVGPMFRTNPILIPTLHGKVIRIDCYSVFQSKIDKKLEKKCMYKLQSKGLTCSDNSSIVGYTNPSGKSSAEGCCPGAVTW